MATMTVWVKLLCFSFLVVSLEAQKRGNCYGVKRGQDESINKILGTWFTLFQSRPLDDCVYWETERSGSNQFTLIQHKIIQKSASDGSDQRLDLEWRDQTINTDHDKAMPILSIGSRNSRRKVDQLVVFNTNYPEYSVLLICPERPEEEDQLLILTSDPLKYPAEEVKEWALRRVRDGGIDTSRFRLHFNKGCQSLSRPVQALPSDVPIKVWWDYVSEDMQRDTVIAAVNAIEKLDSDHKRIAGALPREFSGDWQCIVGSDFQTQITRKANHSISFDVRQTRIMVFQPYCGH